MRKYVTRGLTLSVMAVMLLALAPVPAFAVDDASQTGDEQATSTKREALKTKLEEQREQKQEKREQRLEDAKLRICNQRKKNISTIMRRSVVRAENQLKVFGTISERVQAFYEKKGKVLANYDELVAAVDSAKAAAQTDLEALKELASAFSCESDDPKGDAEAFKTAAKLVAEDLKAYRTAVKNLIVGVKSVQSTTRPEGDES